MTEIGYEATELVERAIRNARPRHGVDAPRWVAVKDAFGVGSSVAHELCRAHGCDPDEIVISQKCEACAAEADNVGQHSEVDTGSVMRVSFTVPMEAIKVECLVKGGPDKRIQNFGEIASACGFVATVDDSDSVVYRPEQK